MAGKAGRSGRHPKPTRLLKLTGNYRRDRHGGRDSEPQPKRAKSVRCPASLSADARPHWRRLAKLLSGLGILTTADLDSLAVLCETLASHEEAIAAARLAIDPKVKQAWLRAASQAFGNWTKLASEFGLTPSGRTRLHVPEAEPDLQELLDKYAPVEKKRHG